MILDELLKFSDAQAITGGTPVAGTNWINTGTVRRNLGTGRPLYLVISVVSETTAGDASDTYTFSLVGDTVEPIDGSSIVIASTTITGTANINAGTRIVIQVPPNAVDYEFIGTYYTTTATTLIAVDAYLTDDPGPDHTVYESGDEGVTV